MAMQRTIQAFITRGESHFVAECHGIDVVTEGGSIDEAVGNLRSAEGEDLANFGLQPNPFFSFPSR